MAIRDFAEELSWTPSYELFAPVESAHVFDHVVVHHGLSNSAVISFIRGNSRASDLSPQNLRSLMQISYNNMIDWHFFVSESDAVVLNNLEFEARQRTFDEVIFPGAPDYRDFLSSDSFFERLKSKRKRSNSENPCDDALMAVVSRWKRLFRTEFDGIQNKDISTLFNALILVRGCEDRNLETSLVSSSDVFSSSLKEFGEEIDLRALIESAFAKTEVEGRLSDYLEFADLDAFSSLDRRTVSRLARDLYEPREAPFSLNFALMSKHALSRIYEKFVAILVEDESPEDQLSFLSRPLIERSQKKSGAVYTPQFIASFFARYLKENTTPRKFREMAILDPACGSGIFLRSILEEQCNPSDRAINKNTVKEIFANIVGVDKDNNALEASRLSLALLYLVTTDTLPEGLKLIEGDAIQLAIEGTVGRKKFDAILTNPPYIKLDNLTEASKEAISQYLGDDFSGRSDTYLAFMKLCLEGLAEGGFACFVIPQTFLRAKNAAFLRKSIIQDYDVRCLVDLSSIRVFEGIGAYSILLIVQKRRENSNVWADAIVAQATDGVGPALQAILDDKEVTSPYYRVFKTDQSYFSGGEWFIRPPEVLSLNAMLSLSGKLSDYLECYQGFVTGADPVFIRDIGEVPLVERKIYKPFLADKNIGRYDLPRNTQKLVFYPYLGADLATEDEIAEMFPQTWTYLQGHRDILEKRKRSSGTPWWKPERPRDPSRMHRPKIVAPHLMLTPRFAVDEVGKYATKHGPFLISKIEGADEGLMLNFFCGILNSAVVAWYIRTHMPTFSHGYSRLEVATLKRVPVPKVENLSSSDVRLIADLARQAADNPNAQRQIDEFVADCFGLDDEDRKIVGMER